MGIALGELGQFSEKLSIPVAVSDEAARICKKSLDRSLARERPLSQIAAASPICRLEGEEGPGDAGRRVSSQPRGKEAVPRRYRLLVGELDLKIPVADPAECLASVACRAKVGPKVEADALEMLSKAEKAGITGGVYPTALEAAAAGQEDKLNKRHHEYAEDRSRGPAQARESLVRLFVQRKG